MKKHSPSFLLYVILYGLMCLWIISSRRQSNVGFASVITHLQESPKCQRLPFSSFLLLPFQRITRIKILTEVDKPACVVHSRKCHPFAVECSSNRCGLCSSSRMNAVSHLEVKFACLKVYKTNRQTTRPPVWLYIFTAVHFLLMFLSNVYISMRKFASPPGFLHGRT